MIKVKCEVYKLQQDSVTKQLNLSQEISGIHPLAESLLEQMSFTTCHSNMPISNNGMVASIADALPKNSQTFDREHAFDNATSINFGPNTAVARNLQSSPFENSSIYQNSNFVNDITSNRQTNSAPPGFPIATMATTIATTIANAITSTSGNNSFRLPEIIPMVCDNGEGNYVPKAFVDRLAHGESLLTETRRELKLERQNKNSLEESQHALHVECQSRKCLQKDLRSN